jgi:hypothetical protein
MVCDQDIAKGTFAKEDFDEVHFKFETGGAYQHESPKSPTRKSTMDVKY